MFYKIDYRYKDADFNGVFCEKIEKVHDWLADWKNKNDNLIICGGAGVGKTWIVHAFLNELAKYAIFVESETENFYRSDDLNKIEYTRSKDFFDTIKMKFAKDFKIKDYSENLIWKWKRCKLLIIDEFPGSYETGSEKIELMDIMDTRWRGGLPTIFITNLNMKGLSGYLQDSLRQRILDNAVYVEIDEKTQRNKPKRL